MNIQNSDATNCTLKLRDYEKPTKFEKNLPLVLTNSCFYSVASKQVGDFFQVFMAFPEILNFNDDNQFDKYVLAVFFSDFYFS